MNVQTDLRDIFVALVKERDLAEHMRNDWNNKPPETVLIVFLPRNSQEERGCYLPNHDPPQVEIYRYCAARRIEPR